MIKSKEMKKIILFVLILGLISCKKEEVKQDCLDQTALEIYNAKIVNTYESLPITTRTIPGGQVVTAKFFVMTAELKNLFELREEAYNQYIKENPETKGIKPLKVSLYCWWCECPVCHWCGNMYPCSSWGYQPCAGWQCQNCQHYPLITVGINCDYGHCVVGK